MHSVANLVAEQADEIVSYTIACLSLHASVQTLVTTCDGASAFRLLQKSSTSGAGRGTANTFVSSAVANDAEDDEDAEYYMSSDVAHWLKKGLTNWYSRFMGIPDYLVQMILKLFPQPGAAPGPEQGDTLGIECYIRVFARVWALLGDASQPPYTTGDTTKDVRLQELKDILQWFDWWHEFNGACSEGGPLPSPPLPSP